MMRRLRYVLWFLRGRDTLFTFEGRWPAGGTFTRSSSATYNDQT